jgi:hypothetical protein
LVPRIKAERPAADMGSNPGVKPAGTGGADYCDAKGVALEMED